MIATTQEMVVLDCVKKYFPVRGGLLMRKVADVKAVNGVSFSIGGREILGLVGESGSGKSTLGYVLIRIYRPTSGKVFFKGSDLFGVRGRASDALRKDIQIVFQDPGSSLNPKKKIGQTLELPLLVHKTHRRKDRLRRVMELLEMVELPASYMNKPPYALSGGQKQRVAIARALATEPSFLLLDEPTSALDVSVQGKIITLLLQLRREFNLTYLFITHDLSLIRNVADRVAIMYLGKIVEIASAAEFFERPLHPYTQMLLSSIPVLSDKEEKLKPEKVLSTGEIPNPVNIPAGCGFHPRCHKRMDKCSQIDPEMIEMGDGHAVRCHLFANLKSAS